MKALIIDQFHKDLHLKLEDQGLILDDFAYLGRKDLLELPNQYQILIVRSKTKINPGFLKHFDKIKCVARGGAGMDGIDTEYCIEKGITLINAPEGNRDAVAEQTIAMTLAWFSNIVSANNEFYNGIWKREQNRGLEIKGKTIGIVGFGNTGKEVARRWASFGAEIITYDIDPSAYDIGLAKPVQLEYLLKASDVVSIHVPLLKQNVHMVNHGFLNHLNSSSLLVNMSRGEIIDTKELLLSIAENRLAGACLDVIEGEQKGAFPKLSQECMDLLEKCKKKVIVTPHVAGWTNESYQRISQVLANKITSFIQSN